MDRKKAWDELQENIFKKRLNQKWHKADKLPKNFGIDMLVVDYRRSHPHVTIERYDEDIKKWFESHPTAMWCSLYDILPNEEGGF